MSHLFHKDNKAFENSSPAYNIKRSDDGDTASVDGSQPNIVQEADDSLSDGEAGGYDNSVSVGWVSQSPVSTEQFTFTTDTSVKVILEKTSKPTGYIFGFC